MADWRQIQARIRKAKTSDDPASQLAELYERTRDAMVAFELAQWHEKAGNTDDTVKWFTTAAQRFRRPQWRTKAEEALTRLGAPIPEPMQPVAAAPADGNDSAETAGETAAGDEPASDEDDELTGIHAADGQQPEVAEGGANGSAAQDGAAGAPGVGKRRRRGRRGGRKRRGRSTQPGEANRPAAEAASRPQTGAAEEGTEDAVVASVEAEEIVARPREAAEERPSARDTRGGSSGGWQASSGGPISSRGRAGDPGLSSRISQLESQLRRLLACQMSSLDDSEHAPAGPGVLLLSDSDQVTHYFVEACQTLRIGMANLVRGGRSTRGGTQLKPGLAEHLGINESRVAKYLKDHCGVRWIQLDEGAAELAHFATAVLRPIVSDPS